MFGKVKNQFVIYISMLYVDGGRNLVRRREQIREYRPEVLNAAISATASCRERAGSQNRQTHTQEVKPRAAMCEREGLRRGSDSTRSSNSPLVLSPASQTPPPPPPPPGSATHLLPAEFLHSNILYIEFAIHTVNHQPKKTFLKR